MKKLLCIFLLFFPFTIHAFTWQEQVGRSALKADISPSLAMDIIACESSFDPTSINYNKNGTADYGLFQINDLWIEQFKHMGFDVVNDPIDNIQAGFWILKKYGTRPWNASKHCWDRPLRPEYSGEYLAFLSP